MSKAVPPSGSATIYDAPTGSKAPQPSRWGHPRGTAYIYDASHRRSSVPRGVLERSAYTYDVLKRCYRTRLAGGIQGPGRSVSYKYDTCQEGSAMATTSGKIFLASSLGLL